MSSHPILSLTPAMGSLASRTTTWAGQSKVMVGHNVLTTMVLCFFCYGVIELCSFLLVWTLIFIPAPLSSTLFPPPSLTRWHLTPPRTARCTPSPAPRSKWCGRIRPWASRVVDPGTSGTSRAPSGWLCGAAGGTRTAAEPGPGLYRTCQCSGNTWLKRSIPVDWVKRLPYSKNE